MDEREFEQYKQQNAGYALIKKRIKDLTEEQLDWALDNASKNGKIYDLIPRKNKIVRKKKKIVHNEDKVMQNNSKIKNNQQFIQYIKEDKGHCLILYYNDELTKKQRLVALQNTLKNDLGYILIINYTEKLQLTAEERKMCFDNALKSDKGFYLLVYGGNNLVNNEERKMCIDNALQNDLCDILIMHYLKTLKAEEVLYIIKQFNKQ